MARRGVKDNVAIFNRAAVHLFDGKKPDPAKNHLGFQIVSDKQSLIGGSGALTL
jgi:hypothetical protein